MNIIRDEEQDGISTPAFPIIPLLVQWGIKRCNLAGCKNNPTTIIAGTDAPVFGMCEHHFQEATKFDGNVKLSLEFDL